MTEQRRNPFRVLLAIAVLTASLVVSAALAQSVVINGVALITSHPPMTMGGSMLLPMRDVFEALNSDVKWREADQRIMATRGNTVIELWIGKTNALVNGEQRVLPLAPMLVNGSTYVPLRFPAEAFGGEVKWVAASRTAFIDIPAPGEAPVVKQPPTNPQPPTNVQPPTNPQPPVVETPPANQQPPVGQFPPAIQQPLTMEGPVIQVVPAPAGLVLQAADTGGLQAVQIDQNTSFWRGMEGEQPRQVSLADVRAGDYAQVLLAQGNVAARVTLSYGSTAGRIVAIAGNTLVLDDGSAYRLSDSVRAFDPAGQLVPLTAITQNTPGQVFFEPRSRTVYELRLQGPLAPPEVQARPQILTMGLLNNTSFFRRGDVLNLQLRGTPGGQAWVSIEQLVDNLPLTEVQPGVYRADYTISTRDDWRGLGMAGNLVINGVPAQPVVMQTRLVICNTPPTVAGMTPPDGSLVPNSSPIIRLTFAAGGDAPIDRYGCRMWVNGRDVTDAAQIYPDEMDYVARYLHPGFVNVQARVRDLAGNEANANWSFNVLAAGDNPIVSVFHEAPSVPAIGSLLNVIVEVANPGGMAYFNLGNLRTNLPMHRRGNTNIYEGSYGLQLGDRLADVPVTVYYRDPNGRQGTMDSTSHLYIDTTLPGRLRIVQPQDGSPAGEVIVASGEAPPYSRVRVTISYTTRLLVTVSGQLWQGTLTANSRGLWQTPQVGSSLGILRRADGYTILAELLDRNGNPVSQQQIRLQPRQPAQPVTVEGVVTRLSQNPPGIVLTLANGNQQTVTVNQGTTITRNVAGAQPARARLSDAQPGDYAQATLLPDAPATSLALTYGQVTGKVVSTSGNTIALEDGTRLRFDDGLRVFGLAGQPLALGGVLKGSTVQVIFEPHSRMAYELRVTALPQQAPEALVVEGMIVQVQRNPLSVVLLTATGQQTVQVNQGTNLTRNVQGAQPVAARFGDVQVGDWAQATLLPGNPATSLALTCGQVAGKVVSTAGNTVVLEDGTRLRLDDAVRVFGPAGQPLLLAGILTGSAVQVTFEPHSRVAYELRVTALPTQPEPPQPPQAAPQIQSLGLLNKGTYFKRGDVLNLQLKGTAGGQATVTIGRLVTNLPLPEVQPGVYQAAYTITARQNMSSQPVTGDLTVGGVKAETATSESRVIIDSTPPAITGKLPADGATIANSAAMIVLSFEPSTGAPIDLTTSHLFVGGQEVTDKAHLADDSLSYLAQNMTAGPMNVKAEVHDLAGNVASANWTFTVAPVADSALLAVFHDATSTLVTGSTLTVTAKPAVPGGVATFSLGQLATNLPMKRKGDGNFYKGTYVVQDGDKAKGAVVTVTYRDAQGKQSTMDATLPVNIDTKLPVELKITQPQDQGQAGDSITVSGQAPPDSRVRVTITYGIRASAAPAGQLWKGTVITNARGIWQTPEIGSSQRLAQRYTIVAELLDADGKTVSQQKVELHK